MKVLVIGAGLIGVSAAWFLRRAGHEVTVVERERGPALATSFANGALLTPSMAEPWSAPGSWRLLLNSLFRRNSPLQLRFSAIPSLADWGLRFFCNSSAEAYRRNTLSNLRLALYSMTVMESLRAQMAIEYGRTDRGSLKLFRGHAALDRATQWAAHLTAHGLRFHKLTTEATLAAEPSLTPIAGELVGSIHYPDDETGDAYQFCVSLAESAAKHGAQLLFDTAVTSIERSGATISAVNCGHQRLTADRYVICAGSYSLPMLRQIGVRLPVQPVKGYSITLDCDSASVGLTRPLVDDALHAAVVPLPGAIRVAGTAEFAGFDRTLSSARLRHLYSLLSRLLPRNGFDLTKARCWTGLRPMSADGVPIIGATALSNLFVSTGHGHLGWTLAAGSAQLLAHLISGQSPSLDAAAYDPARF